jgi:hypothetical protein
MAGTGARGRDIVVRRCETGHAYLNWIVNGSTGSLENFVVEDNVAYTAMTVNGSGPADGDRGLNWHIRRNRGQLRQVGDGSGVVKATRVDGLRIQDNFNTRSPISPGVDVGTDGQTIAPTRTRSSRSRKVAATAPRSRRPEATRGCRARAACRTTAWAPSAVVHQASTVPARELSAVGLPA